MNTRLFLFACISLLLGSIHLNASADQPAVEVRMVVLKVNKHANGKETLAVQSPAPGDTLEYRVAYINRGKASARQLQAVLPLPPDAVVHVPGTAMPFQVMASTDGKEFAPSPLKREVRQADGTTAMVAVPASEYRYLRWDLGDLPPGKSVTVSSRVQIPANPAIH